jgi:Cys-tRNA synthase (O-phospho-L-seryl-tRNA:Cys-tRNA synthase)
VQPWIIKRFVDNGRTIDLLRSTNNAREKEIITMVAMLDLDDDLVRSLMAHAGKTAAHVLACRNRVKGLWAKLGKA